MNNKTLTNYLNTSSNILIKSIIKSTFNNIKETLFLIKYLFVLKRADKIKAIFETEGKHIPSFLIGSITEECNMKCIGCYATANGMCNSIDSKSKKDKLLKTEEWTNIFHQAKELGITFILLAGGEPLMRRELIRDAANIKDIIFPIFTNGSLIDEYYINLFNQNRNLFPIISLEGDKYFTDEKRGEGVFDNVLKTMDAFKNKKIVFGSSITVNKNNIESVVSESFLDLLNKLKCAIVIYVEYVPFDKNTEHLAFLDNDREILENKINERREKYKNIVFLSFPGDEKYMGGCIAGGRGFFHINPYGNAEACPFSPYSDRNLKKHTILEAIDSPLFNKLKTLELIGGEHKGGCRLFEAEAMVQDIVDSK